MSKLPPLRRLLLEDFKTQKAWIGPLLLILNNFMESVVTSFNKDLTIADNTTGSIVLASFTAVPSTTAPVTINWTKSDRPTVVLVGNVASSTGASITLSTAVQVQWSFSNSSLLITNVVGITPTQTNQYTLTLLVLCS